MAWKDTPTKWYPLPIGIGAVLIAFLSIKNRKFSDEPHVVFDGQSMKLQGPWQVSLCLTLLHRCFDILVGTRYRRFTT